MIYTMGESATVSPKGGVGYYDLSAGVASRVLKTFNFIIDGGYTPSGSTGVPCGDSSKGTLLLTFNENGPQGNPVNINVLDGPATGPVIASDVPLNVYAVDGIEPWLQYTMMKHGTYLGKLVFRRDSWPEEIVAQWEERWS